jgi:hypothetical protein
MTGEESQLEASISPDHPLYLSDEKWRELSYLTKFPDSERQAVQNLLLFAKSLAEGDRADSQRARRKVIREAAEACRRLTVLVHEVRERNVIFTELEKYDGFLNPFFPTFFVHHRPALISDLDLAERPWSWSTGFLKIPKRLGPAC